MSRRVSRRWMYALSIPLLASSVAIAQTPSTSQSHIYTGPLTRARLSQVSPERVVVSADSIGDLPGLLTLTLDVAPDGQITAGQWALVVSYVEDLDPRGPQEEPAHEHGADDKPHHEYVRLVEKGTIGGSVGGGAIARDGNGAVTALDGARLTLESGSLTFESVRSGGGTASLGNLSSVGTSRGRLTLTF